MQQEYDLFREVGGIATVLTGERRRRCWDEKAVESSKRRDLDEPLPPVVVIIQLVSETLKGGEYRRS